MSQDTNQLKSIEGFSVLKVKYTDDSKAVRYLFIKENEANEKNEKKPDGKTLFIINVPPFVDEACIRHLFSDCGKIIHVFFHSKPTSSAPVVKTSKYFDDDLSSKEKYGYKVVYVVFSKKISLRKALNLAKSSTVRTLKPKDGHHVGIRLYQKEYNDKIVDVDELQKEIDEYLALYDKRVEDEKKRAKETEGIPDEEGWITVTRHGKRPFIPNKESTDDNIFAKINEKKKKKPKVWHNFYSFQVRESKMENLLQLKKKFEEDKDRIAKMKAARKFNPF